MKANGGSCHNRRNHNKNNKPPSRSYGTNLLCRLFHEIITRERENLEQEKIYGVVDDGLA